MSSHYFYTIGEPRVIRASSGGVSGWRLRINYDIDPKKKESRQKLIRNQTRLSRADSNASKFRLPGLPAIFASEEDALANKKEFHDRVEDVVRGNRPMISRHVAAPPSMPRQFQAARRATRAMSMRARYRQARVKSSRQQRQELRRAEWQCYRESSVAYLQHLISMEKTILLLEDPPSKNMKVSGHLRELTQKKATMMMIFLKYIRDRDADPSNFKAGGKHAADIAAEVGELLGTSKSIVYSTYQEWKRGEIREDDDGPTRPGAFRNPTIGTYERRFLLNEQDLKMKFKKWMRKNLRKLSVDLVWEYLNTTLLKAIDEASLASHAISLPISKHASWKWMKKCQVTRCDTQKTYYNDQHQKADVIDHRNNYIAALERLQRRMRVWVVLSAEEEDKYLVV